MTLITRFWFLAEATQSLVNYKKHRVRQTDRDALLFGYNFWSALTCQRF